MFCLSLSDAGGDHAETGKQTKYKDPNKPLQQWLVRQKRYQGDVQELDRPDCNLNPMDQGQPYFWRTHIVSLRTHVVSLRKGPDRHRSGAK
jgi:hypothetical protein